MFSPHSLHPFEGCERFLLELGFNGKPNQRNLSLFLSERARDRLAQDLAESTGPEPSDRACARLAAVSQKSIAAWLAPPADSADILAIPAPQFRALVRQRLGLPLFEAPQTPPLCPRCRRAFSDPFGDHMLLCLGGGAKTWLHHELRDNIVAMANTGLLRATAESRSYESTADMHFDERIRRMRADIALTLGGAPATIDVTATHALRKPYLAPPLLAVDRIAEEKTSAQLAAGLGSRDLVAAFDTFGGTSPGTAHLLKKIASAYAARFDLPKEATHRFYAKLQAIIHGWCGSALASASMLYVAPESVNQ